MCSGHPWTHHSNLQGHSFGCNSGLATFPLGWPLGIVTMESCNSRIFALLPGGILILHWAQLPSRPLGPCPTGKPCISSVLHLLLFCRRKKPVLVVQLPKGTLIEQTEEFHIAYSCPTSWPPGVFLSVMISRSMMLSGQNPCSLELSSIATQMASCTPFLRVKQLLPSSQQPKAPP